MITLNGKYNTCNVFTDNIDAETISQIIGILNQPQFKNSKIRIMPDCHAGKGCVIGTTMTVTDKVVPNLVGSDIGCGVLYVKLKQTSIDFNLLDKVIRQYVPHGASLHAQDLKGQNEKEMLEALNNLRANISMNRITRSLGTLGGGNHYIEIDTDSEFLYLVIHTGSRHLGKTICEYYQNIALNSCAEKGVWTPTDLTYLEGKNLEDYIHDIKITQAFARQNRLSIATTIMHHMDLDMFGFNQTIHNYVDTENMIVRKGAVSAGINEEFILPLNMRDGALLCLGKGNHDWNQSAPHGAGRLMSRSEAKQNLNMDDYEKTMNGIFTTSVNRSTLDESPMAYKKANEIRQNIQPTAEIIKELKPLYNFKSSK